MVAPGGFPRHRRWPLPLATTSEFAEASLPPPDFSLEGPDRASAPVPEADALGSLRTEYESVVVPLDGTESSERALPLASSIASRMGVKLRLVHVEVSGRQSSQTGFVLVDDRRSMRFYSHLEEYLECTAKRLASGSELETAVEILRGDDVAETLDEYCGGGNSLLVTTRSGRARVARWWNGSVSNDLAGTLRAPVLMVPHSAKPAWSGTRRILVPLDNTFESARHFAEQLRPLGTIWDAEYWLLHTLSYRQFSGRAGRWGVRRNRTHALDHPTRKRAWQAFDAMRELLCDDGSRVEERLIVDTQQAAKSILRHASLYRAQMIALPISKRRRGVSALWHQRVGRSVISHSSVPVLICGGG